MKSIAFIFYLVSSLFGIQVNVDTPDTVIEEPALIQPAVTPAAAAELDVEDLAKCLTESGAKLYGAYWCPHCNDQKAMFGDALQYVDYIECDANGPNADPKACSEAGIRGYPTWIMGDGEELVGTRQLEFLKEKSDC